MYIEAMNSSAAVGAAAGTSAAVSVSSASKPVSTAKPVIQSDADNTVRVETTEGENTLVQENGNQSCKTNRNDTRTAEEKKSAAEEVIDIVNAERSAQRKSALKSDDTLNDIAAQRAREISVKFSHTRPDGTKCSSLLQENGIVNVYAGENIAAGHTSAKAVMDTWMDSDGHRRNILNDNYTRIGVGVYKASDGHIYWVQMFTSDY